MPSYFRFARICRCVKANSANDRRRYPLARILETADLASLLSPEAVPALKKATRDPDSAVRYWGVMGVLMRGETAVTAAGPELHAALADSSPEVAVAAAEALGRYGTEAELQEVLPILVEFADWSRHDVFTVMAALNSLDALGSRAAPLASRIQSLPLRGPAPDPRYVSSVPWLVESLVPKLQ